MAFQLRKGSTDQLIDCSVNIVHDDNNEDNKDEDDAGEYSCLKVELIFKREFSYYLITIYVPCCMLVIVSWVSFWLDQHAIPARVSLGVSVMKIIMIIIMIIEVLSTVLGTR